MWTWFASYELNNIDSLQDHSFQHLVIFLGKNMLYWWCNLTFLKFIHRCCGREGITSGLHSKRFLSFWPAIKLFSMIFYSMVSSSSNFDACEMLVSNNVQLFEMEEFRMLLFLDSYFVYISLWFRNLRDFFNRSRMHKIVNIRYC